MSIVRSSYDDYYNDPYYQKIRHNLIMHEIERKRKEEQEAKEKAEYDYKKKVSRAEEILPLVKLAAKSLYSNLNMQGINFNGKKYELFNNNNDLIIRCLDDGREIRIGLKEEYEEIPDFDNIRYPNCPSLGSYLTGYIIVIRYRAANGNAIQFVSKYSSDLNSFDSFTEEKLVDYLEDEDIQYIMRDKINAQESLNWNLESHRIRTLPNGNIQFGSCEISEDFSRIISINQEPLNYDSREELDIKDDRYKVERFLEETTLKDDIAKAIQRALEEVTKHYESLQNNKKTYDYYLLLAKQLVSAPTNVKSIVESFSQEELEFITNLLQTRLLSYEEDFQETNAKVKKDKTK